MGQLSTLAPSMAGLSNLLSSKIRMGDQFFRQNQQTLNGVQASADDVFGAIKDRRAKEEGEAKNAAFAQQLQAILGGQQTGAAQAINAGSSIATAMGNGVAGGNMPAPQVPFQAGPDFAGMDPQMATQLASIMMQRQSSQDANRRDSRDFKFREGRAAAQDGQFDQTLGQRQAEHADDIGHKNKVFGATQTQRGIENERANAAGGRDDRRVSAYEKSVDQAGQPRPTKSLADIEAEAAARARGTAAGTPNKSDKPTIPATQEYAALNGDRSRVQADILKLQDIILRGSKSELTGKLVPLEGDDMDRASQLLRSLQQEEARLQKSMDALKGGGGGGGSHPSGLTPEQAAQAEAQGYMWDGNGWVPK